MIFRAARGDELRVIVLRNSGNICKQLAFDLRLYEVGAMFC